MEEASEEEVEEAGPSRAPAAQVCMVTPAFAAGSPTLRAAHLSSASPDPPQNAVHSLQAPAPVTATFARKRPATGAKKPAGPGPAARGGAKKARVLRLAGALPALLVAGARVASSRA